MAMALRLTRGSTTEIEDVRASFVKSVSNEGRDLEKISNLECMQH